MKVVHIITGLGDGGAEAALFRLCSLTSPDRHEIISLTDMGKYGSMLEALGAPVTCLGMSRGRMSLWGVPRLVAFLRHVKPDAVQTWMYHANLLGGVAARWAGQQNITWGLHQSDPTIEGTARKTVAVAKLGGYLSRAVPRHIICCARKAADVHAAFGYNSKIMHVVPNGYDLSVFRPDPEAGAALRAELGIDRERPLIGFVARYDPLKDHRNLLAALSLLKARGRAPLCLLVGSGMEEGNAELSGHIAEFGLNDTIRLLGQRNDIPAVMNALDLHVMSSSSEAFPNVLAEAMACGTPCVSTDVGDAAVIVGDSGWIVPPRDAMALADAIASALTMLDRPDWGARKAAAREHVKANFSITRMVDNYRDIWSGGSTT